MEMTIDILVARPRRLARDSGRALAKGVAMRLLGKDGLYEAKTFWASRSGRYKLRRDKIATRDL
jgi:hypothetical protein